jgi:hypothetical protein
VFILTHHEGGHHERPNQTRKEGIKMREKYNGWNNRETWVINLHHGESLQELVKDFIQTNDDVTDVAAMIQDSIEMWYEEEMENMSLMLKDLLYLDSVDWYELAVTYISDCKEEE